MSKLQELYYKWLYSQEEQQKKGTKLHEKKCIMKFKDAPIGARFHFIGDDEPKDVYVKIHAYDRGLIVQWDGNIPGHQSHCCWLDEDGNYTFDTEIELI